MIEYLFVNSTLSSISLVGLILLTSAPPRVNLWVCVVALAAWCIPWPMISVDWARPEYISYGLWNPLGDPTPTFQQVVNPNRGIGWHGVFWVATAFGFATFACRLVALSVRLRRWRGAAEPMAQLWDQSGIEDRAVQILVVDHLDNACVSGYLQPIVWLGRRQIRSARIRSVLLHEHTHIQQHDNYILLAVTLVKDLFWWNPLVRLLAHRACRFIELSCDRRCQTARSDYQADLAAELLEYDNTAQTWGLTTPFFLSRRFNVYRIQQLDKEFSMKKRHLMAVTVMILAGCVATVPGVTDQRSDILNQLTVITITNETDRSEARVEFIGEPEVEKLLKLAKSYAVDVDSRMERDNRRVIEVKSNSYEDTQAVLAAFDGTPMEAIFRSEPDLDWDQPILVDLAFTKDDEEAFEVTLASATGVWTGISTGIHLLRVKPTLIPNGGEESISFHVEISETIEGSFQVVARPRVITALGEVATIKSSIDGSAAIKLELTGRRPRAG